MSLTPESGARIARQLARRDASLFWRANHTYGSLIASYHEDFPKAFVLGHLVRVNPGLQPSPAPTTNRRRGFLYAPYGNLKSMGIKWENLDDTTTCAYAWSYELNLNARQLYEPNKNLFPESNTDFWRTVYLRYVLGTVPFGIIWNARDREQASVYDSLVYAVNQLRRQIPGWNLIHLKRAVFVDAAHSFELARAGGSTSSSGFGRFPVLSRNSLVEVFK